MHRLLAPAASGLALALLAGCTASPATEPGAGRSQPTTVSRALAGSPGGGTLSFSADWRAPFTGDHSQHHAVGCVRDLVVLGQRLSEDLSVTGPGGADWRCAAVVESVSWSGGGPIGLAAYVSTGSAQDVRAAAVTGARDRTARFGIQVLAWDDDQHAWFEKMRTPASLEGSIAGPPDAAVAQAAEVPTRVGPDVDAELFSLYLELSPTPDRQTVTVATGAGRTFTKVFQD